jgi:hypothetical protein
MAQQERVYTHPANKSETGEATMNQSNPNLIRSNPALASIARWFGYSQTTDRAETDIDSDPRLNRTDGRPDYGAYNEAFVIQHWASFGPRF